MTRILFAALVSAAALTTPAAANEMLARSLGVDPGVFTLSELTELKAAVEDNNHHLVRAMLKAKAASQGDLVVAGFSDKGIRDVARYPRMN